MGFLCMGIWISIVGVAILNSVILSWIIGVGFIVCGIGIAVGPLEWTGFKFANKINKISMKILMIFLICAGISLLIF